MKTLMMALAATGFLVAPVSVQLAQRAANRSAADLQDVRRHLSSARGLAITNVSLPPW